MPSSFKFHSAHPCQTSSETFLRPSSVPRSRTLGTSVSQRLTAGARGATLALPSTVPPTPGSIRGGGTRTAVLPKCDLGIVPENPSMIEPMFSDITPAHPCQQYAPVCFCATKCACALLLRSHASRHANAWPQTQRDASTVRTPVRYLCIVLILSTQMLTSAPETPRQHRRTRARTRAICKSVS